MMLFVEGSSQSETHTKQSQCPDLHFLIPLSGMRVMVRIYIILSSLFHPFYV